MITHLHVRSSYTLLNSTLKIKDIVTYAKQNQMSSIALVDKNVMFGAMSFYHACQKENIKPIFGLEVDVNYENDYFNLICYAKDDLGYKQLLKLSSLLNTRQDGITLDTLKTFDQHLYICLGGADDLVISALNNQQYDAVETYISILNNLFEDFQVAIAMNDSKQRKMNNDILKNICSSLSVGTYASSRIYYHHKEDVEAYKALCAIEQKKNIYDPSLDYANNRYFRNEDEMYALYDKQDIENANILARNCNVYIYADKTTLPHFVNKYNASSDVYLKNLCKKGLEKRLHNHLTKEYVDRLKYELDVIIKMGYSDYFLIVYDFIRYARSKDIYVGPGRGSAAGSLVSYCLGITHIDPLKYDLLFERFLNPERISMPDIDVDFPDNRRDEVIDYVKELYGQDNVAHIVTFGTLGAKQVIRDVGRVLNIPLREIDMLAKLVPNTLKVTLQDALQNKKFYQLVNAKQEYQRLIEICLKLEGLPRHTSTHAAGVVISQKPISDVCPIIQIEPEIYSTQYTMEYLEELGLIKMDFLALKNLTIIDEIIHQVERDENIHIDIMNIPLNDPKTFALLKDVDTIGIFQLESEGMKNLLHKMQVHNFDEIAAAIALFRPGPMENIGIYLENKKHPANIDYMHPSLKPILESTYGIMIYQEQVMQVAQKMASFSLAKADILRKAISKKKSEELQSLQEEFIQGSLKNGYSYKLATHVYDQIMKFAGYGFNKSHSIAYALVAYQLAYLKANKPLSFFTSLLNSVIGSERKTSEYIFEARKRRIDIYTPSVNHSGYNYHIEGNGLRYPLLNIKGIGKSAASIIINERQNGEYLDFFDFVARTHMYKIKRNELEALIDAGALDCFKLGRLSMKASLDEAIRYAGLVCIEENDQITIDLDLVSKPALISAKEDSFKISQNEKNVLGFYLGVHPIQKIRDHYRNAQPIISFLDKSGYVEFVCCIERIKEIKTKTNEYMCFLGVSDESDKIDIAVMPNLYRSIKEQLERGKYIYIQGKKDKPTSVLANRLEFVVLK